MNTILNVLDLAATLYFILHLILYVILLIRETEVTFGIEKVTRQANYPRRFKHIKHMVIAVIIIAVVLIVKYNIIN